MKGYICNNCGAKIKGKEPKHCPICGRKEFSEHDFPKLTEHDEEASKKFKDALKILDKYEEGCEPRSLADAGCGCGLGDDKENIHIKLNHKKN